MTKSVKAPATEIKAEPLLRKGAEMKQIEQTILSAPAGKPEFWRWSFGLASLLFLTGGYFMLATLWDGLGLWGENNAVSWAWDITNFVWWIGIGHAGTFISAILLLFRSKWRNSVNRLAESMTLCAITCSIFFILIHVGRPWLVHWIFPLWNSYGNLWVTFPSALVWDAFAILTYLLVSLAFWYLGLLPDLALLRERNSGWLRKVNGFFSMSWNFAARDWQRYEEVLLTLAGLATALVISVHTIVAMDFATTLVKGWHSTILPPYFVIGAIFSGLAMVLTIMIPIRRYFGFQDFITKKHLTSINQLILVNSGLIAICYLTEIFGSWYVGGFEGYIFRYRATGDYAVFFYLMLICNVLLPQLLWIRKLRASFRFSFILSLFINLGMWLERFVIIVSSLSRDYLPSSWTQFYPTSYDVGVFIFSWGLFLLLFLLFMRYIPMLSISEIKQLARAEKPRH